MSSPLGLIKVITITSSFSFMQFSSAQVSVSVTSYVTSRYAPNKLESPVLNQSQTPEHAVAA